MLTIASLRRISPILMLVYTDRRISPFEGGWGDVLLRCDVLFKRCDVLLRYDVLFTKCNVLFTKYNALKAFTDRYISPILMLIYSNHPIFPSHLPLWRKSANWRSGVYVKGDVLLRCDVLFKRYDILFKGCNVYFKELVLECNVLFTRCNILFTKYNALKAFTDRYISPILMLVYPDHPIFPSHLPLWRGLGGCFWCFI